MTVEKSWENPQLTRAQRTVAELEAGMDGAERLDESTALRIARLLEFAEPGDEISVTVGGFKVV